MILTLTCNSFLHFFVIVEAPLEEEMATHSSILAWGGPWTEEPGGLQSVGSQRVRHDSTYIHIVFYGFGGKKKKNCIVPRICYLKKRV